MSSLQIGAGKKMSTTYFTQKRRAYQVLWSKLDEHLLAHIADGVVIAVSGGTDSRALLEATARWKARLDGRFVVASIDHGMRTEAKDEALFIAGRAQRLGFDWCTDTLHMGQAGEHDLRTARYQALMRIAKRHFCKTICLAHHRDDNAEGYFMALMGVGGGCLGAAMEELSRKDDFFLCRPFLSLSKKDLLLALSLSNHTDFMIDRLDERKKNARAFVRHEIFPSITRLAPTLEKGLAIFSKAQQSQNLVLNTMASSLISWQEDGAGAVISLTASLDPTLIKAALWHILKSLNKDKDLRSSFAVIHAIMNDLARHEFKHKANKPGLDHTPNGFNVSHLNEKYFQFPGALVIKKPREIVVRRVLSV